MMEKSVLLLVAIALLASVNGFIAPNTFDKTIPHLSNTLQNKNNALSSAASTSDSSEDQGDTADDIEDLYLVDNANCTSQFLRGLWQLIARGNNMVRGVSDEIVWCYPRMY